MTRLLTLDATEDQKSNQTLRLVLPIAVSELTPPRLTAPPMTNPHYIRPLFFSSSYCESRVHLVGDRFDKP